MKKEVSSQDLVESVLKINYMKLEGADTISNAIRDLFTDIIHIAKKNNIPFFMLVTRLRDAHEVYKEEITS